MFIAATPLSSLSDAFGVSPDLLAKSIMGGRLCIGSNDVGLIYAMLFVCNYTLLKRLSLSILII